MARKALAAPALVVLAAALAASTAVGAPPCSRKNCKEEIRACGAAAGCESMSGGAGNQCAKQCVQQVLVACEGDNRFCTPPFCRNGVVDPGESCEPPGSPGCSATCTSPCGPPPPGEITLACLEQPFTEVGVGAGGTGYLAAWTRLDAGAPSTIEGLRLDRGLAPVDAAPITLSFSDPSEPFSAYGPHVSGDPTGWYVGFFGAAQDAPVYAVLGDRVDASGAVSGAHTIASALSFGMCTSTVSGPLGVAAEATRQFAVLWAAPFGCFNGPIFYPHGVTRVSFGPGGPVLSGLATLDPVTLPQPAQASALGAGIASGAGETVGVTATAFADWSSGSPVVVDQAIIAHWLPPTTGPATIRLSSIRSTSDRGLAVAFGDTSVLVAWPEVPVGGTSDTEIHTLRFTHAGGPLDPDGGLVLATGTPIASSPLVAFDGTTWLVAWLAQPVPGAYDVVGVAVRPDGTIVDATPRVLAAGVTNTSPSLTGGARWLLGVVRAPSMGLLAVDVVPIAWATLSR